MADPYFETKLDATANGFSVVHLPINKEVRAFDREDFGAYTGESGYFNREVSFGYYHDYTWIYAATLIFGFFTAYGIGANDVANAFATSVGAKALKVWQAVVIAAIFEFGGAVLLGSGVAETIRKGIVKTDLFVNHEDLLMVGMMSAVLVVGFWLFAATAFELPVSTTHSAVGAIIGFSMATPGGTANVKWDKVIQIVISWFASPGLSGIIAALLFITVRTFILRHEDAFNRTMVFFPLLVAFTVAVNIFFILGKGVKRFDIDEVLDIPATVGVSAAGGVVAGLLIWLLVVPRMRAALEELPETEATIEDIVGKEEGDDDEKAEEGEHHGIAEDFVSGFMRQTEVHRAVETNQTVHSIHENAEVFGLRTEKSFGYLQVFTAIFDSFSHGANDVANSIGPVAAVWGIYFTGVGTAATGEGIEFPIWILALGGAGIVVGLATYGYKIMSAIGVKMVKVTPTRGFSIELGAAFVIVTGSYLKLPLSTTHCQVGATIGVGLCEDNWRQAINFPLLGRVFAGWVFTLVVAGAGCALVYSFAVYSPSINPPVSKTNCLIYAGTEIINNGTVGSFPGADGATEITLPLIKDPQHNEADAGFPSPRSITVLAGYNYNITGDFLDRFAGSSIEAPAQGYVFEPTDFEEALLGDMPTVSALWSDARANFVARENFTAPMNETAF